MDKFMNNKNRIISVDPASPAALAGILPGDILGSVGGERIKDVFDLMFFSYEPRISVEVIRDGEALSFDIAKGEGENLGLNFETYLMDNPRSCANKCIFCFIDQMPPGMRETLYFKDDDARLSFLQGNYITLTNLGERDVERIIKMRISPVNISVHTTNPVLRCEMLGNRRAGESLKYLNRLAEAEITINAQIVLCPGYNDGAELKRTLSDLKALLPALGSVSIVPVGLTKYRDGLVKLAPLDKAGALEIISAAEDIGRQCINEGHGRVFFCSDEIFLTAEKPLPAVGYYEDFPQLENGVGMASLFSDDFIYAVSNIADSLPPDTANQPCALVTGRLFYPILREMIDLLKDKCNNIECGVFPIQNDFFGHNVTVAGLVTGGDIINQLKNTDLPGRLIIPSDMLRSGEWVFLDDVTVEEIEAALSVKISVSDGAESLVKLILSGN